MKNPQKPTRIDHSARNSGSYKVHSIFETIQGEGPFAGIPCVFVRLAHCNLQCPLCDTEYTEGAKWMTTEHILQRVTQLSRGVAELVVVTGGEPFRQDLTALFNELCGAWFSVQVETNGTLPPPQPNTPGGFCYSKETYPKPTHVHVVVSPKTDKIHEGIRNVAMAYKYVTTGNDSDDGLPITALDHPVKVRLARPRWPEVRYHQVYLQPADVGDEERNKALLAHTVAQCLKFGYRLCVQTHKIVGLA